MTKTTNYQLNQWDASDYVRRTDFNEDNAKIESALGGIERKIRLKTVNVTEATASLSISLEEIDLTQFDRLVVEIKSVTDSALYLRLNDLVGNYPYGTTSSYSSGLVNQYINTCLNGQYGTGTLEFYPVGVDGYAGWRGQAWNGSSIAVFTGHTLLVTYDQLSSLVFYERDDDNQGKQIQPGTVFRLYGVMAPQ